MFISFSCLIFRLHPFPGKSRQIVNQQLRVTHDINKQDVPDLEFHIQGMLGLHVIRAHVYVRQ